MKKKTLHQYFKAAQQAPSPLSLSEVKGLVAAAPPPSSGSVNNWFNLNSILMTTASLALVSALTWFMVTPQKEQPIQYQQRTEQVQVIPLPHAPNQPEEELAVLIAQKNQKEVSSSQDREFTAQSATQSLKANATEEELPTLSPPKTSMQLPDEDEITELPVLSQKESQESHQVKGNTKEVNKSLQAGNANLFRLKNSGAPIVIKTWEKNEVSLSAVFAIEGRDDEKIKELLDTVDLELVKNGNSIEVDNPFAEYANCSCTSTTIFGKKKKKKVQDIKVEKFTIEYTVFVPKRFSLDLKNNYANTEVGPIDGNLEFYGFRSDLTAQDVGGEANLTLKYSTSTLGASQKATVYSFHGDLTAGPTENLELNIKYAKAIFDAVGTLSLDAFQGDLTVKGGVGEASTNVKYGDIELLEKVEFITISAFQSDFKLKDAQSVTFGASYTDLSAHRIGKLEIKKGFQCDFTIQEIQSFNADLQYSNLEIGLLNKSLTLTAFQGKIEVIDVANTTESVTLNTKYTQVELAFAADTKYQLSAETTYTGISLPNNFQLDYEEEQNTKKSIKGMVNPNEQGEGALVSLVSFQGNVKFK